MNETQSIMTGTIRENREVTTDHFLMSILLPPSFPTPKPGQFVMVHEAHRVEPLLARPLSVHRFHSHRDHSILELLYRVTGKGTFLFSRMKVGDDVALIGPLGKGFTLPERIRRVLFVAGGVGVAPLMFLLQSLIFKKAPERDCEKIFYLGARSSDLLIGLEHLNGCCDLRLCTDDGSRGYHGPVTELLRREIDGYDSKETILFACGPTPMILSLRRLLKGNSIPCQVSIEERMACGVGACLGCAVRVQDSAGNKEYVRVCKEGPVFDLRDLLLTPPGVKGEHL